ncbi:cysteine-rich receptor-like protein kinase 25 [Corylus avellana]|uniref:cysteine-rich receptor-like protein kinase 25 n=1 Tax=Corylus avellana TaxID=13451 RepID=UPI00286C937C|nr:cysteine-rich receptor-like protein kinase 25 [Corylus avellana]
MRDIRNRCPADKVGLIWYDECTLQYSNESYLNDQVPFQILPTTSQNVVELDRFNTLVSTTMKSLATQSANSQSGKKFAAEVVNFTSSQRLYCMVQCSPEMDADLCMSCLQSTIGSLPQCCTGKQGGKVLLPSSNIRYELFPFYSLTTVFPGPPSLPPGT